MADGLLPPPSTGVSDIMESAKGVFRVTLAKCLPLALVAILCSQLPWLYQMATGRGASLSDPHDATFWALMLCGVVVYALVSAMVLLRQRALLAGHLPSLRLELQRLLPRWPALVLVSVLATVLVFIGTLALVLPGVFLLVGFLVAQPVVVFEPTTPVQALLRSLVLLRPFWWRACATAVIALLIVLVCSLGAVVVLGLIDGALGAAGVAPAAAKAVGAALMLGVQAVAVVYFSAVWLALYAAAAAAATHSAASSSA
jgi:hypothetical protein